MFYNNIGYFFYDRLLMTVNLLISVVFALLCIMSVICVSNQSSLSVGLKDGVCSSYQLGQFGVGEDSVVGADFQTDPQDHWRGGLQGVKHTHTCTTFFLNNNNALR